MFNGLQAEKEIQGSVSEDKTEDGDGLNHNWQKKSRILYIIYYILYIYNIFLSYYIICIYCIILICLNALSEIY
jgi:uncharacterized membrane protein HdeD (DUF308 family)